VLTETLIPYILSLALLQRTRADSSAVEHLPYTLTECEQIRRTLTNSSFQAFGEIRGLFLLPFYRLVQQSPFFKVLPNLWIFPCLRAIYPIR